MNFALPDEKKKSDWWQIGFRSFISGGMAFLILFFTLWSDNHNDGRYLKKEDYLHDRDTDKLLRDQKDSELNRQLADHSKWLESIGNDVKQLLRENRK